MDTQIDMLDVLDEALDDFQQHLGNRPQTEYVGGQLALIERARREIHRASDAATPAEVLEEAAGDLGLRLKQEGVRPLPDTDREAGILSTWSLCLGYVEGVARGPRRRWTRSTNRRESSASSEGSRWRPDRRGSPL